jgi:hypothetical protein
MHNTRVSRHHITAIVSAICVAIVLAPIAAQAGGPTAHKVTKVKGTVNVGNFPATQNVAGSVNVGNLPATQNVAGSVNVAGTVTANPGLPGTPYTNWANTSTSVTSFTVPSGHHLVIQSVSVSIAITSGDPFSLYLEYTSSGSTGFMYIPAPLAYSTSGSDWHIGNVTTDIYADPGSTVTLFAYPTGFGTIGQNSFGVSGYEAN